MDFPIINSREDLDALAGTAVHAAFMASLAGTLWRLERDDVAQTWRAVECNVGIERFGFTRSDFPDAVAPELPVYTPPAQPSKEQRRRQILDSVGCFNQIHLDKDWALLESERERLGVTEAQAYIDNVMYRGFADARAALAAIDAE